MSSTMASVLEFLLKLMKSASIMFSCLLVSIIFWVFFETLHESCGRENVKNNYFSCRKAIKCQWIIRRLLPRNGDTSEGWGGGQGVIFPWTRLGLIFFFFVQANS